MSAGKGDSKRPVDAKKWASNWEKIDWSKKAEPKKYKPEQKPKNEKNSETT